jgi:type I restriction enzyme R subunit
MAVHNEDSRVKIPTILHIVTFGYDDLSLKAQKGNSNLFNDIFIKAKDLLVSNKIEVK